MVVAAKTAAAKAYVNEWANDDADDEFVYLDTVKGDVLREGFVTWGLCRRRLASYQRTRCKELEIAA